MKRLFPTFVCTVIFSTTTIGFAAAQSSQTSKRPFSFEQFHVERYRGAAKKLPGFHENPDGSWTDQGGKAMDEPHVNFAGEYFLTGHSCGTSCRYYTLNSMHTGREFNEVAMFDAGDPTPRTKDGHEYIPILYAKPDSKLLIVQYYLDPNVDDSHHPCRQRYYVFEGERLHAISKTLPSCTNEGDEPE